MVIEFEKNINRAALFWIVDKIRMKKSDGGAQLLIRKEPCLRYENFSPFISSEVVGFFFLVNNLIFDFKSNCSKDKGLIIHISATKLRLLELADEIGFTKQTKSGMKSFNVGSLDDFVYEGEHRLPIKMRVYVLHTSRMQTT